MFYCILFLLYKSAELNYMTTENVIQIALDETHANQEICIFNNEHEENFCFEGTENSEQIELNDNHETANVVEQKNSNLEYTNSANNILHADLSDTYLLNDDLSQSNDFSLELIQVENIDIEGFIQESLIISSSDDIRDISDIDLNIFGEELAQFDIFNLDYRVIIGTISKEYEYYTKNSTSNYKEWLAESKKHFKECDKKIYGLASVVFIKKKIKQIGKLAFKKNRLCFISIFDLFDQSSSKLKYVAKIINKNENFVLYFITYIESIGYKNYNLKRVKNILDIFVSYLNIFPEFFLPEWYVLKTDIKTKILTDKCFLNKKYCSIVFLIYKSMLSYRKFSIIFLLEDTKRKECFKFYYDQIFVNEMVQLRSILIYICNEFGLIEDSKILNSMSKIHLRFLNIDRPTETQINQFWLAYGCLLENKKYSCFKEWREYLQMIINEFDQSTVIDWSELENIQNSNLSLLLDLKDLTDQYIVHYSDNNLKIWQENGFFCSAENFQSTIDVSQNIINQRIQTVIIKISEFRAK